MAGNYIAYQALKPTESKTGDFYKTFVDDFIKRGDAERAMAFKRAEAEQKSIDELFKDIKFDYKNTLAPFQDGANEIVREGIDFVGTARMMASDSRLSLQEKQMYALKAKNFENDVKEMQTFLADETMMAQFAKNMETIGNGKAFKGDSRYGLFMAQTSGTWKMRRNDDGRIEVGYVANVNEKDPKIEWEPISQVKSRFMTPIEEDKSDDYEKKLLERAKLMVAEHERGNDYVKKSYKGVDADLAKKWVFDEFNYDPKKTAEEQFNVNAIPSELNHFYYKKTQGKTIQTAADFKAALDMSVSAMTTAIAPSSSVVYNTPAQSGSGGGGGTGGNGGGGGDDAPNFWNATSYLQVVDPKTKKARYYKQDGVMMKGSIGRGENAKTVMVQAYWNPNGMRRDSNGNLQKVGNVAFGLAVPVEGGGYTMKPLANSSDRTGMTTARQYLSNEEYSKLLKQAGSYFGYQENQRGGQYMEKGVPKRFGQADFSFTPSAGGGSEPFAEAKRTINKYGAQ